MALILHIETAVDTASVCLAEDGRLINYASNTMQKDHAAWLHVTIQHLLRDAGREIAQLQAIAVSVGPGSYTGLRVGMATAKGLCYALKLPLINIETLLIMATAAKNLLSSEQMPPGLLLVPMIDARRMEVFTAVYDEQMQPVWPAQALIVEPDSFDSLPANKLVIFGNGSEKCKPILQHNQVVFKDIPFSATDMVSIAFDRFSQGKFSELAYSEPLYVKAFYTPDKKK